MHIKWIYFLKHDSPRSGQFGQTVLLGSCRGDRG
jgi:hypothetical protein